MVLSDFLSGMDGDETDPHEIISILFNIHSILASQYYTISSNIAETYKVQSTSATKADGAQMPKVHGVDKAVNPNLKPEIQVKRAGMHKPVSKPSVQSVCTSSAANKAAWN